MPVFTVWEWHCGVIKQDGTIRCRCENAAVVAIVNTGTCKSEKAMQLLRSLFFFVAKHNLVLFAQHIPGVDSGAADALSRNNQRSFFMQVTVARKDPTPIPADLLEALVLRPQDWT